MPDNFANFMRAEWIANAGFCDLKKVSAINRDGSSGFVKVSRYISKYIAKPKNICPWILDGIVEAPRRLSSKAFGKNTIPLVELKNYYTCQDLRKLPISERLDRIVERSRTITLDGVKFPLPRRLKEEMFYSKVKQDDNTYRLEKSALQRLVVARERVRVVESFERQLCAHPYYDLDALHFMAHKEVAAAEMAALQDREARSEKNLMKKLKTDVL